MKKEKQLSPLAVASAVRKYLATLPNEQTPGVRRAALIELWTFRTVLGKRRYERIVYDTCEEIVHELGHPPTVEFPGELWFEERSRIAMSVDPTASGDHTDKQSH